MVCGGNLTRIAKNAELGERERKERNWYEKSMRERLFCANCGDTVPVEEASFFFETKHCTWCAKRMEAWARE
jgi:hypothetical protein